ncbi:hypothetical protein QBC43DRAFT_310907 [Cladorrhinum sp. PSN259]|nr:hypothetical protein QBC43DRAFT_310907 [Cladorrhinum sp. PSN259]
MMAKRTFFLVHGWDSPKDSIPLGSIITNPMHPQLTIFKPETLNIHSDTSTKPDFVGNVADDHPRGTAGAFCTFLRLYGLGDEDSFHYDRKTVLSYRAHALGSDSFEPDDVLKKEAVGADRVAQFLSASDYKASAFMVRGVKTIKGAGVTIGSSKGNGWGVKLSVEGETPLVFAFELAELKATGAGEVIEFNSVGAGETVEALQNRLDLDFGEATFTVIDGFDEADGSECKVVASSPAYLDLLTAGSARIIASILKSPRIKE